MLVVVIRKTLSILSGFIYNNETVYAFKGGFFHNCIKRSDIFRENNISDVFNGEIKKIAYLLNICSFFTST